MGTSCLIARLLLKDCSGTSPPLNLKLLRQYMERHRTLKPHDVSTNRIFRANLRKPNSLSCPETLNQSPNPPFPYSLSTNLRALKLTKPVVEKKPSMLCVRLHSVRPWVGSLCPPVLHLWREAWHSSRTSLHHGFRVEGVPEPQIAYPSGVPDDFFIQVLRKVINLFSLASSLDGLTLKRQAVKGLGLSFLLCAESV